MDQESATTTHKARERVLPVAVLLALSILLLIHGIAMLTLAPMVSPEKAVAPFFGAGLLVSSGLSLLAALVVARKEKASKDSRTL